MLDLTLDATTYMQVLRQRFATAEHMDDFFIASALQKVKFDTTFQSFQRLDQLFASFKQQFGCLPKDFFQDIRKQNTLLLIASHIGMFISKKLGLNEVWQNNQQVKNPARMATLYPQDMLYSFSLNCNNQIIFPLNYVLKHFCEDNLPFTISQEIESIILNYQVMHADQTKRYCEEMHAIQQIFQHDYALFAGQPFQKLLKIAQLDYSFKSLERFDDLMRELRQHHIRSAQHFIAQPANIYFILFLTGYLGRVIAQEARSSLEWYNAEQAAEIFKVPISDQFSGYRVAKINHTMLKVSQHICDFLFSPKIIRTSQKYALTKLEQIRSVHYPLYLAQDTRSAHHQFKTSPYCAVFYQTGLLAAYLLQQLHGVIPPYSTKENLIPTSYPMGSTTFQHPEGLATALQQFELNTEQYLYNALGYKSSAYLPHLCCDAIAIDIQSHGKYPLCLQLVIPYISSFDYRGFHLLQPYFFAKNSKTQQQIEKILPNMGAFFEGIEAFEQSYPVGIRNWHQYYRPQLFPYPRALYDSIC